MFNGLDKLAHQERLALNLVELFKTELREAGAQVICKLAAVEFTNENFLKSREHFACVLGKRVDEVKVGVRYIVSGFPEIVESAGNVSVSAAPAHYQKLAALLALNVQQRNVLGYAPLRCS